MKKRLTLMFTAMLLVCVIAVGATFAYLTSTGTVTNTFTVGKVTITLDEAQVNLYGEPINDDGDIVSVTEAPRVNDNTYTLIPGHEYTKDPTIHITEGSESCYLFVKVENGLADIEDNANKIEAQMIEEGWTKLENVENVENVWYRNEKWESGSETVDFVVFNKLYISGNIDAETLNSYENETITITACAIQADGFNSATAAAAKLPTEFINETSGN